MAGRLVVNPDESRIVQLIFETYLEYQSLGRVRHFLNKKRIPTRFGNGWCDNTVGAILRRRTYTGCIENGHGNIECPELRIIDEEAFRAAQEVRKGRRGLSTCLEEERGGDLCGRAFMREISRCP